MPSKPLLSQHPELSAVRVYMIGLALGCSTGVDFWASAMMGVAGTHIRGGVHASPEDFLWTLTSYAAAAVVANLMLRRLAHDISYRGFTMAGLVIAAAGKPMLPILNPMNNGRRSSRAAASWMMMRDAANSPPAPKPCTARASASSSGLRLSAQSAAPAAAITSPAMVKPR